MILIVLLKLVAASLISLPNKLSGAAVGHKIAHTHPHSPPVHSPLTPRRDEAKRGLNIGLQLKVAPEKTNNTLQMIEKEIAKVIGKKLGEHRKADVADKVPDEKKDSKKMLLKPAFECDRWESKSRTCWLDRNTGDTVTFSLSTGVRVRRGHPDVIWKKGFAQRDSQVSKEYVIDPKKISRNLVIGRRGYELRVSPITELDVDDNQFSASFDTENVNGTHPANVNFRIRIVAEDLGFVYIGETLDLSIESYVTLPLESMVYHWYTEKEGESASLPSNMRVSSTGETLRISELRQEQEGIVACSVYTNMGVHATKKRFLIKELAKGRDVLKSFSDHTINYYKENQRKRSEKTSKYRGKRLSANHSAESAERRLTLAKPAAERAPKIGRDIDDANLGGEHYTMVKADRDSTYRANPKQYSADDGIYTLSRDMGPDENGQYAEDMSFGNSTDLETVVNIDMDKGKNAEEDKISQTISYCLRDLQCSKHASCVRTNLRDRGFCRCLPGFYGPGIFCREDM